ncbi:S-layer homology domain-containing protein [Brevibacillus humidisoli]|uniref:S-layer homology domain-containing protein n=1 Tax=Brevibacillus humidisoli TaxID=2895522 RepID=UPI001E2C7C83|nr:S-layer homology domain-containing protein [Brevibacillus humidisoli]UFJ41323.1 S-layer homology domain-containing protein [Brevibacillus humidisoli]
MKRMTAMGMTLVLLISPISVFAEQKDVIKLPGATEQYTIYDQDGNSVTVTFDHEEDEIRVVITPPDSPDSDEGEVIVIPKEDEGGDDKDDHDRDDDKDNGKDNDSDKDKSDRGRRNNSKEGSTDSGDRIVFVPANHSDIKGHWAEEEILALSNMGFIQGYPDGTFRPNNPISRAEFAALLERALNKIGIEKEGEQPHTRFKDVPQSSWYYLSVNWLENRGNIPIDKYPNGLLKPNEPISREEMALWLAKEVASEKTIPAYKDLEQIRFQEEVREAAGAGLLRGYPDDTFRPQGLATRAEAVTILMRFMLANGDNP